MRSLAGRDRGFWIAAGAIAAAALASIVLIGIYVQAGGTSYRPAKVQSPCRSRPSTTGKLSGSDDQAVLQRIVLLGLDRTACSIGATREDLVLAVTSEPELDALLTRLKVPRSRFDRTLRASITAAVGDAKAAGGLSSDLSSFLVAAVGVVPVARLLDVVQGRDSSCVALPFPAKTTGTEQTIATIALITSAKTACTLHQPIQDVLVALTSQGELTAFENRPGLGRARVEQAARTGAHQAVGEAVAAKALPAGTLRDAVDAMIDVIPLDRLIAELRGEGDPCQAFPWQKANGTTRVAAEIVLIGAAKAACETKTSVTDVALSLQSDAALSAFLQANRIDRNTFQDALRSGLKTGIDEADHAGQVNGFESFILKQAVDNLPLLTVIDQLRSRLG